MAEYIEREKVLELIGSFKRDDVTEHVVDYAAGWNEALEQIESNIAEDIPAADVCPERHGEWIHLGGDEWGCSCCGFVISTESSRKHPMSEGLCNDYCSHCGAKMDGKDVTK